MCRVSKSYGMVFNSVKVFRFVHFIPASRTNFGSVVIKCVLGALFFCSIVGSLPVIIIGRRRRPSFNRSAHFVFGIAPNLFHSFSGCLCQTHPTDMAWACITNSFRFFSSNYIWRELFSVDPLFHLRGRSAWTLSGVRTHAERLHLLYSLYLNDLIWFVLNCGWAWESLTFTWSSAAKKNRRLCRCCRCSRHLFGFGIASYHQYTSSRTFAYCTAQRLFWTLSGSEEREWPFVKDTRRSNVIPL